uniref:Uncharacterized protein n=1 Tax=Arion vulgaris TaxID=1028688 RepID=A0A0B7A3R9_9EUPU
MSHIHEVFLIHVLRIAHSYCFLFSVFSMVIWCPDTDITALQAGQHVLSLHQQMM